MGGVASLGEGTPDPQRRLTGLKGDCPDLKEVKNERRGRDISLWRERGKDLLNSWGGTGLSLELEEARSIVSSWGKELMREGPRHLPERPPQKGGRKRKLVKKGLP